MIRWINEKEKEGSASFYETNLTLNSVAAAPFETVEYVRFGIDEAGNVVVAAVPFEDIERELVDVKSCYKMVSHKGYARVSSTALLRSIASEINMKFGDKPLQFPTIWNEKDNHLIIRTGGLKTCQN